MSFAISVANFNSIKVQLELDGFRNHFVTNSEFQFHKGTIRTQYLKGYAEQDQISIP